MTTKVRVDSPICDKYAEITAVESGDKVLLKISSDCKSVQHYAEVLGDVGMDELLDIKGSRIMDLASEVGLTATCLVPVAVYNACWIEKGMISKRLALAKGHACIEFLE